MFPERQTSQVKHFIVIFSRPKATNSFYAFKRKTEDINQLYISNLYRRKI